MNWHLIWQVPLAIMALALGWDFLCLLVKSVAAVIEWKGTRKRLFDIMRELDLPKGFCECYQKEYTHYVLMDSKDRCMTCKKTVDLAHIHADLIGNTDNARKDFDASK